jgi:hypothetical protein
MDNDIYHLDALTERLCHERQCLANAKSDGERELRAVWVSQIEREIEAEKAFLAKRGIVIDDVPASLDDISDDEFLAELFGGSE